MSVISRPCTVKVSFIDTSLVLLIYLMLLVLVHIKLFTNLFKYLSISDTFEPEVTGNDRKMPTLRFNPEQWLMHKWKRSCYFRTKSRYQGFWKFFNKSHTITLKLKNKRTFDFVLYSVCFSVKHPLYYKDVLVITAALSFWQSSNFTRISFLASLYFYNNISKYYINVHRRWMHTRSVNCFLAARHWYWRREIL